MFLAAFFAGRPTAVSNMESVLGITAYTALPKAKNQRVAVSRRRQSLVQPAAAGAKSSHARYRCTLKAGVVGRHFDSSQVLLESLLIAPASTGVAGNRKGPKSKRISTIHCRAILAMLGTARVTISVHRATWSPQVNVQRQCT